MSDKIPGESWESAIRLHVEMMRKNLAGIAEREASAKAEPDGWSKKEILGHLVDSAGNNLQRFVRAMLSDELTFPEYQQTRWVEAQGYQIPPSKLMTPCRIGTDVPIPLERLIHGYVWHVEHHLQQISESFSIRVPKPE